MNHEEYLQELAKQEKVINILKKRLDMAYRSRDAVYAKRCKTIQDALSLDTKKKYTVIHQTNDVNINNVKKGYFNSIEYNPKYDNFVLRLRPIKKDGTPAKQPEALGDAVLITNIVSYAEIID